MLDACCDCCVENSASHFELARPNLLLEVLHTVSLVSLSHQVTYELTGASESMFRNRPQQSLNAASSSSEFQESAFTTSIPRLTSSVAFVVDGSRDVTRTWNSGLSCRDKATERPRLPVTSS